MTHDAAARVHASGADFGENSTNFRPGADFFKIFALFGEGQILNQIFENVYGGQRAEGRGTVCENCRSDPPK